MSMRYNENNRTTTGEADKLLGTTSDGKLPAVDGSQLTNLNISSGSNTRSLTYVGAYGTVVTVNVARNSVYTVSSSGPNFTITSALRTSYAAGDLIYIVMYGNTWCSLVNSDTAAGTKLFVKGIETTNHRFQQSRATIKLRLTTHTNGNLYIHVCDDLEILDDLTDVVDTHAGVPVGATLKYNPYLGKWRAKQNWLPKSIVINNDNAINYLTKYSPWALDGTNPDYWNVLEIDLGATKVDNVPSSPNMALHPTITGWTDFFNDADFYDYDHFVIVLNMTPNTPMTLYEGITSTTYQQSSKTFAMKFLSGYLQPNSGIAIHLPPPDDKWIGKKITFICDGINTNTALNAYSLRQGYAILRDKSTAGVDSAYIDSGNGTYSGFTYHHAWGPSLTNSDGNWIMSRGAHTLMLTDDTLYPQKAGSTGETTYANAKFWVEVPF